MTHPRKMLTHACGHLQTHRAAPDDLPAIVALLCNACWSQALEGAAPRAYFHHGKAIVVKAFLIAAELRAAGYHREYAYVPDGPPGRTLLYRGAPAYVKPITDISADSAMLRELGCHIQEDPREHA